MSELTRRGFLRTGCRAAGLAGLNGKVELYNLNVDPGELNNVVSIMPEKAAELTGLIHQWRKKNRVPMPVPR